MDRFEHRQRDLRRNSPRGPEIQLNTRIHPLSAATFNLAAREGDPDWRVLYLGCGDGGSGESRQAIRQNPQRLDTLVGKILRIIPNPTNASRLHPERELAAIEFRATTRSRVPPGVAGDLGLWLPQPAQTELGHR